MPYFLFLISLIDIYLFDSSSLLSPASAKTGWFLFVFPSQICVDSFSHSHRSCLHAELISFVIIEIMSWLLLSCVLSAGRREGGLDRNEFSSGRGFGAGSQGHHCYIISKKYKTIITDRLNIYIPYRDSISIYKYEDQKEIDD